MAEPVACAVNGLAWSHIQPGDRVAVIGAGFMGLLLIQGLRATLCAEVTAIDIDGYRLELARKFGAQTVINPEADDAVTLTRELEANPLDVVIESAGTQSALDLSYRIVRPGGVLNIFSSHRGSGSRDVDIYEWHHKGLRVFNTSPKIEPDFVRVFHRTIPLMRRGVFDLTDLVTHRAPPEGATELFEAAIERREGFIKGVVMWE
jgi:threonine dehydrogenase-like Zn-dependent dehydrogenase